MGMTFRKGGFTNAKRPSRPSRSPSSAQFYPFLGEGSLLR